MQRNEPLQFNDHHRTLCAAVLVSAVLFSGGHASGAVFPCDEAGVVAAIAAGGGPHTFSCGAATTVITSSTIVLDQDVVLDGEGLLTLDGNATHGVLQVESGVTTEIRRLHVTNGARAGDGGGIRNGSLDAVPVGGVLTLSECSVTNSAAQGGGGVANLNGSLIVMDSTISGNSAVTGGGISSRSVAGLPADLTLSRSTVSGNGADIGAGVHISGADPTWIENTTLANNFALLGGGAVMHEGSGTLDLVHVTIAFNFAEGGSAIRAGIGTTNRFTNSIIAENSCNGSVASLGGNIDSPGDSCFFSDSTDQSLVPVSSLALGALTDNGGPTSTHSLGAGSVAIDAAVLASCPSTDQRGVTRPEPGGTDCDSGAYEAVPEPSLAAMLVSGIAILSALNRRRGAGRSIEAQ